MPTVLEHRSFSRDELLATLRRTRLKGFDQVAVYADAALELRPGVDPETLAPAQRYVLRENLARVLGLRDALLPHGIDVFALDGGVRVRIEELGGKWIPVIPPIVEDSREPDGRTVPIICDGLHRVYAARSLGVPISVVRVRGVPSEYPYYAYALDKGWADVTEFDELPDVFEKKTYRMPQNYTALFRVYDDVFPGVQDIRKVTDPPHLRP